MGDQAQDNIGQLRDSAQEVAGQVKETGKQIKPTADQLAQAELDTADQVRLLNLRWVCLCNVQDFCWWLRCWLPSRGGQRVRPRQWGRARRSCLQAQACSIETASCHEGSASRRYMRSSI